MHPDLSRRYDAATRALSAGDLDDFRVAEFVLDTDKGFSTVLSEMTVGQVRGMSFYDVCGLDGVGHGKVRRLIEVLERVAGRADAPTAGPPSEQDPAPPSAAAAPVGEEPWPLTPGAAWAKLAELAEQPANAGLQLGEVLETLTAVPPEWWAVPLRRIADRTPEEWNDDPAFSTNSVGRMRNAVVELMNALPPAGGDAVVVLASRPEVVTAKRWAKAAASGGRPISEFGGHFFGPLMRMVESDADARTVEVLERRIGNGRPAETLEEVAAAVTGRDRKRVTRERIRQIEARGQGVVAARWPDASVLLDDLWEAAAASGGEEDRELCRRALQSLFGFAGLSGVSDNAVMESFRAAARDRQTPMPRRRVLSWAGETFPSVPADRVAAVIEANAVRVRGDAGGSEDRFLSDTTADLALDVLHRAEAALSPAEVAAAVGPDAGSEADVRSIKDIMLRDPRVAEDKAMRFLPAERCGVTLEGDAWCVTPQGGDAGPVPVVVLGDVIAAGLLHQRIADVTAWGLRRYANGLMKRLFGGKLPAELSSFALVSMLVNTSPRFHRQRRHRIRFDGPGTPPALNKFGWVDRVVNEERVVATPADLVPLLRKRHQVYKSHVYAQLGLTWTPEATPATRTFESKPLSIPFLFFPSESPAGARPLPNAAAAIRRAADRTEFTPAAVADIPFAAWLRSLAG